MNKKWLAWAAELLKEASEEFSNHGCNDMEFPEDWSEEEKREFNAALFTWNDDESDEEYGDYCPADWFVMDFLAAKLEEFTMCISDEMGMFYYNEIGNVAREKNVEIENLNAQIIELMDKLQLALATNDELNNEINRLERDILAYRADVKELRDEIRDIRRYN